MAESILSAAYFHNEEAAYAFVEARIWPKGPVCPHCGGVERNRKMQGESTRIGLYKCYDCRKPFTVKIGTIFESSHIAMRFWLQAIFLMASSKKGISANQMHRTLGITLKSAWFMMHRIREAMGDEAATLLGGGGGIVEADETYMTRRKGPRSGEDHASPVQVASLVSREGKTRSFHVANVDGDNLKAILLANLKADTHLMTDGAILYRSIGRNFARHEWVNHTQGQYAKDSEVNGVRAHSNTVESYFAILKRGIIGAYHHVSEAHLQRYLNEFDFRFSNRQQRVRTAKGSANKWEMKGPSDFERAVNLLIGVKGKRLTYQTVAQ